MTHEATVQGVTGREVHLALSTGRVACSGKLSARYKTEELSLEWPTVTCSKCRKSDEYIHRRKAYMDMVRRATTPRVE